MDKLVYDCMTNDVRYDIVQNITEELIPTIDDHPDNMVLYYMYFPLHFKACVLISLQKIVVSF